MVTIDVSKDYPNPRILQKLGLIFGCDPEFFLERDGSIIGAEKVIPKEGLIAGDSKAQLENLQTEGALNNYGYSAKELARMINDTIKRASRFVLDGVQLELNPAPNACRELLGRDIARCLKTAVEHLKDKSAKLNFSTVIEVPREEYESLSPEARTLGCVESKNLYDSKASVKVEEGFRGRSAGGHIHIGLAGVKHLQEIDPRRWIQMLDLIVGNTCVLLDRDPKAAERRQVYGRAGEYRLPPHGIEYRTLSNWWMRSYETMSLVMGLVRLAGLVLQVTEQGDQGLVWHPIKSEKKFLEYDYATINMVQKADPWDAEGWLLKRIDPAKVARAINENDFSLAAENYQVVREFVQRFVKESSSWRSTDSHICPLSPSLLEGFDYAVIKGLDHWLPKDPLENWLGYTHAPLRGWEKFVAEVVMKEKKELDLAGQISKEVA